MITDIGRTAARFLIGVFDCVIPRTARTSKAYRTSHKPYWALHSKSRVNYTIVFGHRKIENVLKYCDSIVF